MTFKIDKALKKQIDDTVEALREFVSDARSEWDDRSERWQESDRGVEADAWIETVEQMADDLEDMETKP